ncbi:hypothetical protein HMPREF1869_00480 [Bacteroidales bacterium KA00251]|nr:hypothetical protein HMPREF1869_00480 [Bacteroidales bacterium KA00251]
MERETRFSFSCEEDMLHPPKIIYLDTLRGSLFLSFWTTKK